MSWWRPLVIVVPTLVAMIVLQTALVLVAHLIDVVLGGDMEDFSLSPLMMLGTNLSLALTAPIAVGLMAWVGKVPWRAVLAQGRGFSWRALGRYALMFTPVLLVASVGLSLLMPGMLSGFAISATTVGLLVVAVLTTPLQAAGEEVTFRGVVMPSIAAWVGPTRAALVVGTIGSSLVFGLVHAATDPWLIAYYTLFGASAALMAVVSRGLEASIAFHVVNNLVNMVIGVMFTDGGGLVIDRTAGNGGPVMVLMIVVDLLLAGLVWLLARRDRASARA